MALEKKKDENDELKFLFYIKHYSWIWIKHEIIKCINF